MADFTFAVNETNRGPVMAIGAGERTVHLHVDQRLLENPRMEFSTKSLRAGLAAAGEALVARAADLTPTGFNKLAREEIAKLVAPPFQAVQAALPRALADLDGRRQPLFEPRFSDDQTPAIRVEQRQHARTLPLPKLMEQVAADPALAMAIVEGGLALSGLPADIFDRIKNNMAVHRATTVLSGQTSYKTKPTADDPVGGQVDHAAAKADAEALIAAYDDEEAVLGTVPTLLGNTVTAVALMLDMTRPAAFEALSAA